MDRIRQLEPAARAAAQEYVGETDPDRARFAAVFLLLRRPSQSPFLPAADSAAAEFSRVDRSGAGSFGFSDNCFPFAAFQFGTNGREPVHALPANSAFLSRSESTRGAEEWNQLKARIPSGADYLGAQAIAWAQKHPNDLRVPEALHLAVQASRRGCRTEQTGDYSRQAFDLLHGRYPRSEWTAETKYWFK